ncbi:amidohydrolase [Paenibacillus sp. ACRRX]|uniref:amidohydrolase n=1 Tax=Paenibacillus sp. ACRRX TaxID=2918206 RepID=UPI001EF6E61A|nr:amidohydrolase [Paenibacillus sp. ACRRX]MCG7407258.1 amidohydrolase [Paenibacillus sp. ACRRX]
MKTSYWIKNVSLDTGYLYEDEQVVGTCTGLLHIRIADGLIQEIVPRSSIIVDEQLTTYDANGKLLIPSFHDAHIHLDKTFYGGSWRAVRPAASIFERIEQERKLLPELIPVARQRTGHLLDLLLSHGSTHVRGHVNIDPVSGLRMLESTLSALDDYKGRVTSALVAFPQHGLLHSDSAALVRAAVQNGAQFVGAVDPATVDRDIERSLQTVMDIAVETGAGIDVHIHDQGAVGLETLVRLADLTEEAGWQDKVTVSHAFAFATNALEEVTALAKRFGELGIAVTSTVPIGRMNMPIPLMSHHGVPVMLGTDSVTDHWSPFGNGDNLEKVGRLAELYGYSSEFALSQSIKYITNGISPLDEQGNQVWPSIGDEASLVLVEASCTAEAVARRAVRKAVIHKGALVYGSMCEE